MKKNRRKIRALIALCVTMVILSGCKKKSEVEAIGSLEAAQSSEGSQMAEGEDVAAESETDEYGNVIDHIVETAEAPLVEETTREPGESLPDVAVYDDTVLENYVLEINNSERYTINIPKEYEKKNFDKYKTYLVKENTQIFIYCINQTFEKSNEIYYSTPVQDALYRFPYQIDGVDFTASVMDRKAVSSLDIKGKKVAREIPVIEFASIDKKNFVKPVVVSYFVPYDDRGFALIAVSTDQSEGQLDTILTDMVSTLGTYIPGKTEALYEFDDNLYVANDKTGISFPYPAGWTLSRTDKGYIVISAPKDGSLFDGAKIIYKSDSTGEYVTDYAQYAGIPDDIAYIYMNSHAYAEEQLKSDFMVMAMDDAMTLDGVPCHLFQIEDYIKPQNKTAELLLPSTGAKIYSYRYTFNSNGIPAMVSFHYTANNQFQVRDMAEQVMSKMTLK